MDVKSCIPVRSLFIKSDIILGTANEKINASEDRIMAGMVELLLIYLMCMV